MHNKERSETMGKVHFVLHNLRYERMERLLLREGNQIHRYVSCVLRELSSVLLEMLCGLCNSCIFMKG